MSSLTQEAPTAQQDVASAPRRRPGRSRTRTVLRYVLLVALALVFVSPLVFMLVTSFKSRVEAAGVPPTWVPAHPTTQAYRSILGSGGTPVLRWFANSMVARRPTPRWSWSPRPWRPTRSPGCGSAAGASSSG